MVSEPICCCSCGKSLGSRTVNNIGFTADVTFTTLECPAHTPDGWLCPACYNGTPLKIASGFAIECAEAFARAWEGKAENWPELFDATLAKWREKVPAQMEGSAA